MRLVGWFLLGLWLVPCFIAYGLGFATALLVGPIRRRWLDVYDEEIDPPQVRIPIVREFARRAEKQ